MNTCASFVLLLIPFNKMKEGPNSYLLLSGHKLTLSLLCHLCYPFFWEARKKNLFLNCEKEPEDILLIRKQKQEVLIPRCNLRVELTICVRKLALIRFVAMSGGPSVTTCVTFCPPMSGTDDRCFPETILTLSPCLQEL